MPRPNPHRSLRSETNLARRIAHERDIRQWTYEGTAKRLTDAGCPIQPSAIYKIEKADPPRRISVDELVAFAAVFETSVEQLLMPPEMVQAGELHELFDAWESARARLQSETENEASTRERIRQYLESHPDLDQTLQTFVREWVSDWAANPDSAEALWMYELTGSQEWSDRLDVMLNARRAERRAAEHG